MPPITLNDILTTLALNSVKVARSDEAIIATLQSEVATLKAKLVEREAEVESLKAKAKE